METVAEPTEVSKLKVSELRTMLSKRNLDTKGPKVELVKRLNDSFANESFEAETAEEPVEADVDATPNGDKANLEGETVCEPMEDEVVEINSNSHALTEARSNSNNGLVLESKKLEDEPIIADNIHCLDWYDSDLSLVIEKDNMMTGEPICRDGWAYVWSGARSSRGFDAGKVWFEVKVLGSKRTLFNEIRIGWSTNDTDLMLGNVATSFAYCSKSGQKRDNNEFSEYGPEFGEADVIGAFVDFTGSSISMNFTKNGEPLGEAFNVSKTLLNGHALFPHVSTKTIKFEVNFGKEITCIKDYDKCPQYTIEENGIEKKPWFPPLDGYQLAAFATSVPNFPRIDLRENCEMIMMIGLPGCGKTTWIEKLKSKNPEKRYNAIGINAMMDRMETDGEPIMKKIQGDKWKRVVSNLAKSVTDWITQASKRRRNFILDQTNVYSYAHSKNGFRIVRFNGMILKAVVIVPSDEDYNLRVEGQKKVAELAKDRYISAENQIMAMKAEFALPVEGSESPFTDISYVELNRDEAAKLVEEYNKLAKEKGFRKRSNFINKDRYRNVRKPRGMRGMQSLKIANNGSLLLGQLASTNMISSSSREAMMQQVNLMQNGWKGSSIRKTLTENQGLQRLMFDQNQIIPSLFGAQMMYPPGNQLHGRNASVNKMLGGGYYGMGMNPRQF